MPQRKIKITARDRDLALDESEIKELYMTNDEIKIRDNINKKLSLLGFHLRLSLLQIRENGTCFDYVPPIHNWFEEISKVDSIVQKMISDQT